MVDGGAKPQATESDDALDLSFEHDDEPLRTLTTLNVGIYNILVRSPPSTLLMHASTTRHQNVVYPEASSSARTP